MVRGIAGRYSSQPEEPQPAQPQPVPPTVKPLTEGDIKWAVFVGVFWALVLFSIISGIVGGLIIASMGSG